MKVAFNAAVELFVRRMAKLCNVAFENCGINEGHIHVAAA